MSMDEKGVFKEGMLESGLRLEIWEWLKHFEALGLIIRFSSTRWQRYKVRNLSQRAGHAEYSRCQEQSIQDWQTAYSAEREFPISLCLGLTAPNYLLH